LRSLGRYIFLSFIIYIGFKHFILINKRTSGIASKPIISIIYENDLKNNPFYDIQPPNAEKLM
jgi:uncharacterized membrane protein